jgi:hypothetical protein
MIRNLIMATNLQISFEPFVPNDQKSFDDFYRIYADSISPVEQKPRAMIAAMASLPEYRILLARSGGVVIGLSVIFEPADGSFCLLEYMAVDAGHRNAGAGAALFRHGIEVTGTPMLLEVDSEIDATPDLAIRHRRQGFYRRLGCRRIEGLSYRLPWPGLPAMDLLVHLPSGMSQISKPQLEGWLRVVYQKVYHRAPDDPRIAEMMAPVTDPVGLV